MSNLLECYIHSLINNINKPINKENKEYNLIIDGGAFNCAFSGGCLYYINELEKLNYINLNRPAWLGTSDSSHLMTMLDTMIEYKGAGKPEMLAQIFNSLGKEGTSSVQVTNATRSPRGQQAQSAYDTQQVQQQYQQQYEQQQAMTQAQQQPVNPQAPYPQATR